MIAATLGLLAALAGSITAAPSDEAKAYYPAQIGDTWSYESSVRGPFTNEVVDSVVVDGAAVAVVGEGAAAPRR